MIFSEIIEVNGNRLVRTHSDAGFLIRKVGTDEIYGEAVDPEGSGRAYEETNIPIATSPEVPPEADISDYLYALGEMGVDTSD